MRIVALALDETKESLKSSAIVRFVCLSLAGDLNFMMSLARFAINVICLFFLFSVHFVKIMFPQILHMPRKRVIWGECVSETVKSSFTFN